MRLLVLGGTKFLGRAAVETALARGHEVTLFNRGETNPELFPDAEPENFMKETGFRTQVRSLRDVVVGEAMTRSLWILFGAVLLVLFIAAANLSSLFLVRADARRRETAVRAALAHDSPLARRQGSVWQRNCRTGLNRT